MSSAQRTELFPTAIRTTASQWLHSVAVLGSILGLYIAGFTIDLWGLPATVSMLGSGVLVAIFVQTSFRRPWVARCAEDSRAMPAQGDHPSADDPQVAPPERHETGHHQNHDRPPDPAERGTDNQQYACEQGSTDHGGCEESEVRGADHDSVEHENEAVERLDSATNGIRKQPGPLPTDRW